MKFEKWWFDDYQSKRREINVNYMQDLKVGFLKKISTNTIYSKCKSLDSKKDSLTDLTDNVKGSSYVSQNGYLLSIWIKHKDEELISIIRKALFKIGFLGVTSLSDFSINGFLPDKSPNLEKPQELLENFQKSLSEDKNYFMVV